MNNFEKMRKRKVQLDGGPKKARSDKRNKPVRGNQKHFQGDDYLQCVGWFEGEAF